MSTNGIRKQGTGVRCQVSGAKTGSKLQVTSNRDQASEARRQEPAARLVSFHLSPFTFHSSRGFSLIEVALALVVVAVGVLAMFGLMASGLDASSKSVSETQAAIFSQNVMNAIRVESVKQSKDNFAVTNQLDNWQTYWKDFSNRKLKGVELPGWPAYSKSPIYINVTRPGEVLQLALTNLTFRGGSATNQTINLGLRYKLEVKLMNAPEGYSRHIPDQPSDFFTIVGVTLKVWDGLYGVGEDSDAIIFYSEFNNPGTL